MVVLEEVTLSEKKVLEVFTGILVNTKICRYCTKCSDFLYGDKCLFAHGRQKLRDATRNNKYKRNPVEESVDEKMDTNKQDTTD